jgi:ubiquinone/menaquinone biosynthesis C-methylase UbiE
MNVIKEQIKKIFGLNGRSLDADLRYYPVADFLRNNYKNGETILELGSGDYGVTPYFPVKITGVDIPAAFTAHLSPLVEKQETTGVHLPFGDESFDYVLSVDMLEHVSKEDRVTAINEMMRVAGKYVIFTVPTGELSEKQDEKLYNYYLREHAEPYPFLSEHLEYGLPRVEELQQLIEGNEGTGMVQFSKNVNLQVREIYMRIWINKGILTKVLFKILTALSFLGPLLNFGDCYRSVVIVRMKG